MSANIETMFSVRTVPWHGLGEIIADAPTSEEAIRLAGLDWNVYQTDLITDSGLLIPGFKANEYSCAMKSHFRKSGNQMSGKWKSSSASLLA